MKAQYGPRRWQHGATLIEALVSLVVMSFGLLGIAGLQLSALSLQKSAWSTHRISEITSEFAERVRANAKAVDSDYQYTAAYTTGKTASLTKQNCRTSGTCTATQLAADDLADLLVKAQMLLPEGSIQVRGTLTDGLVVTSMYKDKDFVDASSALQTTPTCQASTTGTEWRNCCPAEAAVPEGQGIRCRRFTIIP
jgi:type IV pilus assembly protein PilV